MCPALEKPNLHIDNACVFFIIFYYFFFHPKSVIIHSQIQNPQPQLSYQQQYTQNQHTTTQINTQQNQPKITSCQKRKNHGFTTLGRDWCKNPRLRSAQKPQAENRKTMGTGWVLMKWPRNGFVEMGIFEREMGWRVEQ